MRLTQKTETFGTDDQSWLGSAHGTSTGDPVSITVDGTLAATGVIPSGTVIDDAGLINTSTPTGFLLEPVRLTVAGTYVGAKVRHGFVVDGRRVAKGLAALTTAQKTALAAHFVID